MRESVAIREGGAGSLFLCFVGFLLSFLGQGCPIFIPPMVISYGVALTEPGVSIKTGGVQTTGSISGQGRDQWQLIHDSRMETFGGNIVPDSRPWLPRAVSAKAGSARSITTNLPTPSILCHSLSMKSAPSADGNNMVMIRRKQLQTIGIIFRQHTTAATRQREIKPNSRR